MNNVPLSIRYKAIFDGGKYGMNNLIMIFGAISGLGNEICLILIFLYGYKFSLNYSYNYNIKDLMPESENNNSNESFQD